MWEAWNLSKTWNKLPSECYFIKDEVTAFYFNRAVRLFGTYFENALKEIDQSKKKEVFKKADKERVYRKLLDLEEKGIFADPMQRVKKE